MWLHRWTPQREVAGGDDLNDLMSKTIAAIAERVENNVIYFIDTGEKWPSVASIASVIGAEVWLSSLVAFFLPVLVCQCIINDIAYFDSCILRDAHMKIAGSVQPIQVRRTLSSQYVQCVAKIQAALLNNFLFSFGCFVLFAQTLRRVISASLSISKPPVHANKGKSVSTDKNGQNRQVFLSEKERYSNSFGRGQQALRMTSSLDARGHYGWLHPWTPQREGDSLEGEEFQLLWKRAAGTKDDFIPGRQGALWMTSSMDATEGGRTRSTQHCHTLWFSTKREWRYFIERQF